MRTAILLLAMTASAAAETTTTCRDELKSRGVAFAAATKPGIADGVEITGPLGGVAFTYDEKAPLVIDCSLAVSLDEAGKYMAALGMDRAIYVSAYSRRNVRGTDRPSKHSYGLAIDISAFRGAATNLALRVDQDFEQGLGGTVDCIGKPLTPGGQTLKILQCQLVRSGLFHLVLTPDYDDAHHDHFHLEVKPWRERPTVRAASPAIH